MYWFYAFIPINKQNMYTILKIHKYIISIVLYTLYYYILLSVALIFKNSKLKILHIINDTYIVHSNCAYYYLIIFYNIIIYYFNILPLLDHWFSKYVLIIFCYKMFEVRYYV